MGVATEGPVARSGCIGEATRIGLERRLKALEASCQRLLLDPQDEDARNTACLLLQADLSRNFLPGSLSRGLAEEVRAHGDDLAMRLEAGAGDNLQIRAAAARLCQTLVFLRAQLSSVGHKVGWPSDGIETGR